MSGRKDEGDNEQIYIVEQISDKDTIVYPSVQADGSICSIVCDRIDVDGVVERATSLNLSQREWDEVCQFGYYHLDEERINTVSTDLDFDKAELLLTNVRKNRDEGFEQNLFTYLKRTAQARIDSGLGWKDCRDVTEYVAQGTERMVHKRIWQTNRLIDSTSPEYEDLFQSGWEKVITAFKRWNPDKCDEDGNRALFSSYVQNHIFGGVRRELESQSNKVSSHYYGILKKLEHWSDLYESRHGITPTVAELSVMAGINILIVKNALAEKQRCVQDSIENHILTLKSSSAEAMYMREEIPHDLQQLVADKTLFDDTDRMILNAALLGHQSVADIARATGIASSEVKNRRSVLQIKLAKYGERRESRRHGVRGNRNFSEKRMNHFKDQNDDYTDYLNSMDDLDKSDDSDDMDGLGSLK